MLFPQEVLKKLIQTEVTNLSRLALRLQGLREYPVRIPLKVPTMKEIVANIALYQEFMSAWNSFEVQECVERTDVAYRNGLDGKNIPAYLTIRNFEELMAVIPRSNRTFISELISRCEIIAGALAASLPLADTNSGNYSLSSTADNESTTQENNKPCASAKPKENDNGDAISPKNEVLFSLPLKLRLLSLIRELSAECITTSEINDLTVVLPQLKRGLGQGLYIRALPLHNIDTKFLETHARIITSILKLARVIEPDESLEDFLGVLPKPEGFAHIRCLDPSLGQQYSYMQVPTEELTHIEPLGSNILVVENVQSGLMLPELPDTTVIFGCGKNLNWARAPWLSRKKKVIYWGDLDSWGLEMLGYFRKNCQHQVESVLMNLETILARCHQTRMVPEKTSTEPDLANLLPDEIRALEFLKSHSANRLEQEKLDQDYALAKIKKILQ